MSNNINITESVGLGVIKFFRRLFLHTPLNRVRITGIIREWIYKSGTKSEDIVIQYMGVQLKAPSHDLGFVPGLVGGYYEKAELIVYKALLNDANMIVDVGGNIGLYSVIGAKYMPRNGRVVAFEPIPNNVSLLKENLALNDVENKVTVEQIAIGDSVGKVELYISEKSIGNHSASADNAGKNSVKMNINRTSLDKYFEKIEVKSIDILKIDIEGYDYYALKGALKVIKKHKPTLFVEFMPELIKNCMIKPVDYANLLFKLYDHCYVVDELKNTLHEVTQDSKEYFIKKISNNNLVLVNIKSHMSRLEKFIV